MNWNLPSASVSATKRIGAAGAVSTTLAFRRGAPVSELKTWPSMEAAPGLDCAARVQAETNPASKKYFIRTLS